MPRWPKGHKTDPTRNYKKEAAKEDTPQSIKDREARNKARRKFEKAGKVHKGDGLEVDHKRPIGGKGGGSYDDSNLHVISRAANRRKQPKRK